MASDSPSSDIVLSVKPNAHTATNDGQHRYRQRQPGNHRRAPGVEEQEDHDDGQGSAFEQRFLHAPHRIRHADAGVTHDAQRHAGRQGALNLRHLRPNHVCHRCRAVALRLDDVDADRLLAVVERDRARFLGRIAHGRDVAEANDAAVRLRHNQECELRRRLETPPQANGAFVEITGETPDGRGEVL